MAMSQPVPETLEEARGQFEARLTVACAAARDDPSDLYGDGPSQGAQQKHLELQLR